MSSAAMFVTAIATEVDAHAAEISIIASAYETTPASAPPSSDGMFTPLNPSPAISLSSSAGNAPSRSRRLADGATLSRAKLRAVSRISFCVSFSSKSMSPRPPGRRASLDRLEVERELDGVVLPVLRLGEGQGRQHRRDALVEPRVLDGRPLLQDLRLLHEPLGRDDEGGADLP